MRVLVVSYYYTPQAVPRAIRWSTIVERWLSEGISVDIVTGPCPEAPDRESQGGLSIHRVGSRLGSRMRERLNARMKSPSSSPNSNQRSFVGSLKTASVRGLKRSYDVFYKNFYWPDAHWTWHRPAKATALTLLSQHDYSAIVSVSHPFTGHWVGLDLKRRFPGIPWLVDIGDPFCLLSETPTNNHRLYGRLNTTFERRVFASANAVSVTTPETLDEYAAVFPESAAKIRVIPPLFSRSPDRPRGTSPLPAKPSASTRLLFIGTLYRQIRNPSYLLKLFRALSESRPDLELHFIGEVNDCGDCFSEYAPLLNQRIFLHGPVSHPAALRAMADADVLVNLGNSTRYQLPSKVVEYASFGKPILNVCKSRSDSSVVFFRDYPRILNIFEKEDPLGPEDLSPVEEFMKRSEPIDPGMIGKFLGPHQPDAVARSYLELIVPRAP